MECTTKQPRLTVSPLITDDPEMVSKEFFAGTTFDESPPSNALPLPSLAWLQNPRHNLLLRFEAAAAESC